MPFLWFFDLLTLPHPVRASSNIVSEKSSPMTMRKQADTCTHIWLQPKYTLQISVTELITLCRPDVLLSQPSHQVVSSDREGLLHIHLYAQPPSIVSGI